MQTIHYEVRCATLERAIERARDHYSIRRHAASIDQVTLTWERLEDTWQMSPERAPAVRFSIRAQSFCHNMVRALTSTLVAIGKGARPESTLTERLDSHP